MSSVRYVRSFGLVGLLSVCMACEDATQPEADSDASAAIDSSENDDTTATTGKDGETATTGAGKASAADAGKAPSTPIGVLDESDAATTDQDGGTDPTTPEQDAGRASGSAPASGPAKKVSDIRIGSYYACRLLDSGDVECWGRTAVGVLGALAPANGNVPTSSPVKISGLPGKAISIATGDRHACAVISGGEVYCWGSDTYGELGDDLGMNTTEPRKVAGVSGAVSVTASGTNNTCVLLSTKKVLCWGGNSVGAVGTGEETQASVTSPQPVIGLDGVATLHLGGSSGGSGSYVTSVAMRTDGTVWAWGSNLQNRLGLTGTSPAQSSAVPAQVPGLSAVRAFGVGTSHACALLEDKTVTCAGANNNNLALGRPTGGQSAGWGAVPDLTNVSSLCVGDDFTCVVHDDGLASCWGNNLSKQLGTSDTTSSIKPVLVAGSGLKNAVSVSCGSAYACAVLSDGGQNCWGQL
ncbi:MAG: hypothetical protein RL385_1328 [Pseudomonadota bacterium]